MILHYKNIVYQEFDRNITDYCLGGPKKNGWTRIGEQIEKPKIDLLSYSYKDISVDEILAKNISQVHKWHLDFLLHKDINNSKYLTEYLLPRYGKIESECKANMFLNLLEDIRKNGLAKSVWVADIEKLDFGFKYFRFDGCHRTCCCKILGFKSVRSMVFKTNYSC